MMVGSFRRRCDERHVYRGECRAWQVGFALSSPRRGSLIRVRPAVERRTLAHVPSHVPEEAVGQGLVSE